MTTTKACAQCSKDIDTTMLFCPICGSKQTAEGVISPCSGVTAWVLCIFLGYLGAHRFYVGKIGTGILMLLTFGGFGIWYVYDYYSIPCKNFTDAQGRYVECQRNQAFPIIMACFVSFFVTIYITAFGFIGMMMLTETTVKDVAKKQLSAIQENKLDEAYSYESSESISSSDFNDFVKQHPEFSHGHSIQFPDSKYNDFNSESAKLEAQLISDTGEKIKLYYEFKKINREWKIVKIEISPEASQDSSSGISE